ncbi:nuclease-related domain-containing protein [Paraliobacillus zengyii]|uniref:nuclease-related domain-containing protein n=1 Tax=Paraliobacillus zengyii TaxID=2213194 RepID=UPI000DD3CB15|nr:nuclease-related domain-containing protein [Paraliobacillus zengyii]
MAQLIKIENYISRYQRDTFHYPGQFIRLKQENWRKLVQTWEYQLEQPTSDNEIEELDDNTNFSKWKSFFQRREQFDDDLLSDEQEDILPKSKTDLKQYYLDTLLPFQLKWASTTINQMSFLDRAYHDDLILKYFLQRFPDTFLLLYHPVFQLKNATLDGDIILITPVGIDIIHLVEKGTTERIVAGDDRTWYTEENNIQSRFLSPMLSLKRTEKIVRSILSASDVSFPIKKIVLSRTNNIDFFTEPYLTNYIGKEQHEEWLSERRNFVSPLKHNQLKVAEAILQYCDTAAVRRPEWDIKESDDFST